MTATCEHTPTVCAVVLAEDAIEGTGLAECDVHALIAVADVVMVEGAANGQAPSLSTWWLGRGDGRKAAIYRLPAKAVTR